MEGCNGRRRDTRPVHPPVAARDSPSERSDRSVGMRARATDFGRGIALRLPEEDLRQRHLSEASNSALEQTAGSHALAAAAHRERSAQMTAVCVELPERVLVPCRLELRP
jgi:hypothetical protein